MVKVKDLSFSEPKTLPTIKLVYDDFGISFNYELLQFERKKLNNPRVLLEEGIYPLADFILDYYEMDYSEFKVKFERLLDCKLNASGYILGMDNKTMSIRNLAYFANKEKKFPKELSEGRDRGVWVNTIHQDIRITTSQTNVVMDFVNKSIDYEELKSNDIIMLKYLKKIDNHSFSIYKIFNSVDVRDKKSLFHKINVYADGFFGQNEDYSEGIDRLELDIIEAIKGGCNKRELKSNDFVKRIIHPKASNNNCFFKCIQPYIPELKEKIIKSECK